MFSRRWAVLPAVKMKPLGCKLQTVCRHWTLWFTIAVIGTGAIAGCKAGTASSTAQGKVTLDGQPLTGAAVSFALTTAPTGRSECLFVGVTDDQGNFVLRPANPRSAGMPAGKY